MVLSKSANSSTENPKEKGWIWDSKCGTMKASTRKAVIPMPKSPNQKLKLLYLARLLLEKSDETHPVSMDAIIQHLAANDIAAERKSLYDDIDALRRFGYDIAMTKSRPAGYYLASRAFELPELKLLVDSVQASQFITKK